MLVLLTYAVGWLGRPETGQRGNADLNAFTREQGQEPARTIEGNQLVATADVGLADVNLRDGASGGPCEHLAAAFGIEVDTHLLDLDDPARAQQLLGPQIQNGQTAVEYISTCGVGLIAESPS
jgi:hypothetical protein